jgi:type III pantothenate kinase
LIFVVDSGNTYTKIGQFVDGKLTKIHQKETLYDITKIIQKYHPDRIIAGSVNFNLAELHDTIPDIPIDIITTSTPVPFEIKYQTPTTLGIDRLAGVAGAWNRNPNQNILVIDTGTCITYDFIDNQGCYWGGSISPGMDIRFRSLHEYTADLPMVEMEDDYMLTGKDTRNSILSGVINGIISEIEGIISKYIERYQDLTIFMSGGSSIFFETKIKHSIFAFPNMVLLGLYSIYEFNSRKRER